MTEPNVEQIVAAIETEMAKRRDTLMIDMDSARALIADWRKRGEALEDIAQQKLIEEYAAEADPNTGDWEGAYDACVRRARAVLPPKP